MKLAWISYDQAKLVAFMHSQGWFLQAEPQLHIIISATLHTVTDTYTNNNIPRTQLQTVPRLIFTQWQEHLQMWLDLRKPSFQTLLQIFRNTEFNYFKFYNSEREADACMKFAMIL